MRSPSAYKYGARSGDGRRLDSRAPETVFIIARGKMKGNTLHNVCHCGLFTYFVLLSFMPITASVSFDLTELRNKVAKIKVNPRGNLWATGKNFMSSVVN